MFFEYDISRKFCLTFFEFSFSPIFAAPWAKKNYNVLPK
jgi:hypothetical protein